jgi:hypothetical protein
MARKKTCDCGILGGGGICGAEVGTYATLHGKVLVITVGDENRPASKEDCEDVEKVFAEKLKGIDCRLVVTHHAVRILGVL